MESRNLPGDLLSSRGGNNRPPANIKENRHESWIFVINNPNLDDYFDLEKIRTKYMIWAIEEGDLGTTHIQGYLHRSQCTRSQLSKMLRRAHLEVAKGDAESNRRYITGPWEKNGRKKEAREDYYESGTLPQQGKRNDLLELRDAIKAGKRKWEIMESDLIKPYAKSHKVMNEYIQLCMKRQAHDRYHEQKFPTITVFHGKAGTGKTRQAFTQGKLVTRCQYTSEKDKIWFDSYEPGDILLFDEFTGDKISFEYFKELTDIYPITLPLKGGTAFRLDSDVVITSNNHPKDWWGGVGRDYDQILRRMTIIDCDHCEDTRTAHAPGALTGALRSAGDTDNDVVVVVNSEPGA